MFIYLSAVALLFERKVITKLQTAHDREKVFSVSTLANV